MPRPDDTAAPSASTTAERPTADRRAAARLAAERGGRSRGADSRPPAAAPPFATAWASLVYVVATMLLAFPALAGRFLVNPNSDQYIAGYAFREFGASVLRQTGGFAQWNPYLFDGMPFVAAMHGDIFYPPSVLLRMLLPTDVAMTWGFILHIFVAGLFTYQFLRAIGVSFFGALIGGLAYMLGGNVAGLVSPGHDGKLYLAALLPLVLLLTYRAVREGRRWAYGTLAITITMAVLTPHPQLLQYLLLVCGAWALFLALSTDWSGRSLDRRTAIVRLGSALAAVVVGMLGGAIQFAPVLQYAPWSPRAGGKGWEHAISYSMPPEELINTYLPQFSGILDHYWGRNGIHLHSEYIGAAVLVLTALGLGGSIGARRKLVWFWGGVLLVALLWALGGYTPFYHLVYALVPGTKFFRAPSTMLYVISFATAVLAGFGVDRALEGRVSTRFAIGAVAAGVLVAVMASGGLLTNLGASIVGSQRAPLVDMNQAAVSLGGIRSLVALLAAVGIVVALGRRAMTPAAAGWALSAVVALDLWSIERMYWMFSAPAAQLYASDAVIDFLKRAPEPGRVVPLATQDLASTTRDPYFGGGDGRADGLMVHGIRSVVGYHGNELGRFLTLSGWPEGGSATADWPRQLGNPNFWRLSNIRYLYTNAPQPPLEGMRLVAGPVRNVAGNMVYLYQFPGDNPAAWVTTIAVKAADDNVLATVLDPRFDVNRVAIFDTAAAVPTQAVPQQLPEPIDLRARVSRWAPGRITLDLDRPAPAGSALVVSESFYPGWRATVDGKAAPVGRADYLLIGVGLPAGGRHVELAFDSSTYETGKLLTVASLGLALLGIVAGIAADRRRALA
jgi:hypothetical protein